MFSREFLKDLAERAIATAVQTAIPLVVAVETIADLDYKQAGLIILTATVLAVLKGVAAKFKGDSDTASLNKA